MPTFLYNILLLSSLFLVSCEDDNPKNNLAVNRTDLTIESEGGEATLILQTDAPEWRIQNPTDWITLSQTMGSEPSATITITVSSKSTETRTDVLTILAGDAKSIEVTVTQAASEFLYTLSSNYTELYFKKGGNSVKISVTSEAPDWQISSDADWLQFNPESGPEGETEVLVTAIANATSDPKEATVSIVAEYAPTVTIIAKQIGEYYPDYNTNPLPPDASGMGSTAMELSAKMGLGINIGNTLEAIGGETAWGNPKITKTFVHALKTYGFTAVRLPCSYDQYSNQKTGEISAAWLDRIKEVVQYCIDEDLYVLLNIHWDGGWLNVTSSDRDEVSAKQKAYWQQIATHLREYDERLMFASANEPGAESIAQMNILMSYHQTFIDAVRSTGGRNSHRVLVFQGASTDIEKTNSYLTKFPTDEVPNKLMAELHYYTPYQFTLMESDADWGKMFYYWGKDYHSTIDPTRNATWGEEDELDRLFEVARSQFVMKGYPVIMGEFGAYKRANIMDQELHNSSIEYFNKYVVKASLSRGMIPYYWDTGGMINRGTGAVKDQALLDAILEGAQ